MHWVGMDVARWGGWFVTTFWNRDGHGVLPDIDMARNVVLTALTFALGWATSLGASKSKLKARVIDELILCQSELFSRAYPSHWRRDGVREAWMLDPFVARLRFLYSSLNEQKSLSRGQLDAIEYYMMRIEEFVIVWAVTQNRGATFHESYKVAYQGVRKAVQDLGLKQMRRLNGLASPKDELFGAAPATLAPTSHAPSAAPNGAFVPAE